MAAYPVRYRLPTAYCTEIGRLVTRFAVIEAVLRTCAYALLDITPKQGRVAVRLGRIEDTLTAIEDLAKLAGITFKIEDMPLFKSHMKDLEGWRDKFAHGVWVKHAASKSPVLQVTSGFYQSQETNQKTKARISPRAAGVSLSALRDFNKAASAAKILAESLKNDAIRGMRKASREKSRLQQRRHPRHGHQGRTKKTPAPQPQRH